MVRGCWDQSGEGTYISSPAISATIIIISKWGEEGRGEERTKRMEERQLVTFHGSHLVKSPAESVLASLVGILHAHYTLLHQVQCLAEQGCL